MAKIDAVKVNMDKDKQYIDALLFFLAAKTMNNIVDTKTVMTEAMPDIAIIGKIIDSV